ncbi:MAG: argininosuccinate synthase [Methermicoccaceae archaeon]
MKKVVLAYSGGLDTSVCVPLLKERYGFDHVTTVVVDVGQPDISEAEAKGKQIADEHFTIDAKEEFVTEYLFPLIKANGCYEGYVLGTAVARPLIARKIVSIARSLGANAVAHGCTGKGNDQLRFEAVFRAEGIDVIAPMREFELTREWEIDYAKQHNIPVPATHEKPWSIDENIWSRSIEGGELEDPSNVAPEEAFEWTENLWKNAPPEEVVVDFERGVPVAVNGESLSPVELVQVLNKLGGAHGVGRTDMMEDRILGLKARETYEHPAATILLTAHRDLEALTLTRAQLRVKRMLEREWAEISYRGVLHEPLFSDINAFIDSTQTYVTGWVKLRLFGGTCMPISRFSPHSIYSKEMVSFDIGADGRDAEGFSRMYGLQARLAWEREKRGGGN